MRVTWRRRLISGLISFSTNSFTERFLFLDPPCVSRHKPALSLKFVTRFTDVRRCLHGSMVILPFGDDVFSPAQMSRKILNPQQNESPWASVVKSRHFLHSQLLYGLHYKAVLKKSIDLMERVRHGVWWGKLHYKNCKTKTLLHFLEFSMLTLKGILFHRYQTNRNNSGASCGTHPNHVYFS